MRALLDLFRALFIRPDQLSVPMQEKRDLAGQLAAVTAERDQWRRRALDVEQAARALLANLAEYDEVRYGAPVADELHAALARHGAAAEPPRAG